MTTATVETAPRTPASRPNLVSVGTIIWLSSELMFFAALFAMYFTVRSVTKGAGLEWPGAHLDIALGSINTTVLLLSSVTCQMGVFAVERGQIRRTRSLLHPMSWGLREWYVLTFLMGLYFDLGQSYEYYDLVTKEGLTLASRHLRLNRQCDGEGGPFTHPAFRADLAAVGLDDFSRNRQA